MKNSNVLCDIGKSVIHVKNSSGGFCKVSIQRKNGIYYEKAKPKLVYRVDVTDIHDVIVNEKWQGDVARWLTKQEITKKGMINVNVFSTDF